MYGIRKARIQKAQQHRQELEKVIDDALHKGPGAQDAYALDVDGLRTQQWESRIAIRPYDASKTLEDPTYVLPNAMDPAFVGTVHKDYECGRTALVIETLSEDYLLIGKMAFEEYEWEARTKGIYELRLYGTNEPRTFFEATIHSIADLSQGWAQEQYARQGRVRGNLPREVEDPGFLKQYFLWKHKQALSEERSFGKIMMPRTLIYRSSTIAQKCEEIHYQFSSGHFEEFWKRGVDGNMHAWSIWTENARISHAHKAELENLRCIMHVEQYLDFSDRMHYFRKGLPTLLKEAVVWGFDKVCSEPRNMEHSRYSRH